MDGISGTETTLRKVESYEKSLCPWCGVHPSGMVFSDSATVESPLLRESPWAHAALYWAACTACGHTLYDVEVSVVADAPPGMSLLNDHRYEAAGHTLYLARRGRREWRLVHLKGVRKIGFALIDPPARGDWARELEVPWLDEHIFCLMKWRSGWNSVVKLTDTLLPCLRRITWPQTPQGQSRGS